MIKKIGKFFTDATKRKNYIYRFMVRHALRDEFRVKINGMEILVPIRTGAGFENIFMEESWMSQLINRVCKIQPGAFIDVGVNLGQTLLKYKTQNIAYPYFGFEPNPNCFMYSKELVRLNRFSNAEIFPVGLSDCNDLLTLYTNSTTDSAASMIKGFRAANEYSMDMRILVMQADEILRKINPDAISIVKIDVEGAELEVLRGLKESLSKYRPFIICEILPVYDENTDNGRFRKQRQDEIESILADQHYTIFRVLPNAKFVELSGIETHGDMELTNYLFVPACKLAEFRRVHGPDIDLGAGPPC